MRGASSLAGAPAAAFAVGASRASLGDGMSYLVTSTAFSLGFRLPPSGCRVAVAVAVDAAAPMPDSRMRVRM